MTTNELDKATLLLIADLAAKPQSFDRDEIIRRAKKFKYHDYKSDHPTPETLLVKHLVRAGFRDLAELATQDRYASGPEEAKKWEQTEEGQRALANMQSIPDFENKMNDFMKRLSEHPMTKLTPSELVDIGINTKSNQFMPFDDEDNNRKS